MSERLRRRARARGRGGAGNATREQEGGAGARGESLLSWPRCRASVRLKAVSRTSKPRLRACSETSAIFEAGIVMVLYERVQETQAEQSGAGDASCVGMCLDVFISRHAREQLSK